MGWHDLFAALALYLILEGIMPFANPSAFKRFMNNITTLPDQTLRNIGLGSMVVGLILLYMVH